MDKLPFENIKREIHVKKEAETSLNYGKKPEENTIEELINYGVINLNKPSGPTSHQVSEYIQRILNIQKSGHSGTLDPKVTGCLPIALGRATRIVQTLLKSGKEYVCLMYLHKKILPSNIHKITKEFTGKIRQIPPIKSAVKRQERTREIYYINILEIQDQHVLFKVGCEAGTYIRKLCHDMAIKMGTKGHMVQLVRTKAGPFNDSNMFSLHDLKDAYEFYKEGDEKEIKKIILPIEKSLNHLPKIWVLDSTIDSLCHGSNLNIPGISKLNDFKKDEIIVILSLKDELVCLGTSVLSSEDILKQDKGKAISTKKVFMPTKTYLKFTSIK
ncbi:MAG: RNA-guided pseudouridylation complex pseudouridine synthase subunit Cbf5 [Nanoarchaeota archaeon]|nr:RNA-guided pseudouridylation complex pseudouridine synthase subunit Cbf5 [Nanoarchaeota archaeon]